MEEHGYTVIRCLGQGGCQNRVYEVRNPEGRLRVVKQLPWVAERDREMAMREVRLLSSLRHPCIVPYLESFLVRSTPSMPSEDILCLVMSRCERDLRQECLRLRLEWELKDEQQQGATGPSTTARFPEPRVLSWLAQLCWGLQHLHARKFLHRDLKPQNVLLSHGSNRAMLADFGVAGQVEHTEDFRRSIVGTPAFMSPEMLEGRPYGLKTDQWALGCVLYEMMALEPPFAGHGESYAAVVSAVLHAPKIRAPAGFSPGLAATVEALMARKPHNRPSNHELLRGPLLHGPFHAFIQSLEAGVGKRAQAYAAGRGGLAAAASGCAAPPTHEADSAAGSQASEASSPLPRGANSVASSLMGTTRPLGVCGSAGIGISGRPLEVDTPASHASCHRYGIEADVASYTSDFEDQSQDSGDSPEHSQYSRPDVGLLALPPRTRSKTGEPRRGSVSCGSLSGRSELHTCRSCGPAKSQEDATITGDGLGGVGLGADEWRQLLAEAEALLQPPLLEEEAVEEASRLRAMLAATLGSPPQVDLALSFLQNRRPLGDTVEADELVLQVELLDLLGDEALHTLPLLERVLALEGYAACEDGSASAL
mmetsp:Transcript_83854/g.233972  ORF Transcript_83854/g.233972 Transcript_83854/m.233972 type:complete len:595 (+) Transcript_83854:255-2039(+)